MGNIPESLGAAFDPILSSETTPSLEVFLELGRALNKARLYDFIDEAMPGGDIVKSCTRGLLNAVTRGLALGLGRADRGDAEVRLASTEENGQWLHVRDELRKFFKLVDEELGKRSYPLGHPAENKTAGREQVSPAARAIAVMLDYKTRHRRLMPMPELLKVVPDTSKSTLYRDAHFMATRKAIKESLRAEIPRGFKSADGTIEAFSEQGDEED